MSEKLYKNLLICQPFILDLSISLDFTKLHKLVVLIPILQINKLRGRDSPTPGKWQGQDAGLSLTACSTSV